MTYEEFKSLWPQLVELGPSKVVFTGGEPLLRTDIFGLLNGLRNADRSGYIRRCLNTNGHLVTPDVARRLIGLADEVRVSLDALADRNDVLRGKGNFTAALRALDTLYNEGFEPKVLVTFTTQSAPDLEEFIYFLLSRNIRRININVFRPIGRGEVHLDWLANIGDAYRSLKRAWMRCYPDQTPPTFSESENANCGVGQFLNILPNGNVFPCHVLMQPEFRLGNVRHDPLKPMCSRDGLMGALAGLSFADLAGEDEHLKPLSRPHTCMGTVYEVNRLLPIWGQNLRL
jgi:MoaA/NifB/PqqE/SkfB family radical SAM enzyme